jgi:tol-pal system protein YbgF
MKIRHSIMRTVMVAAVIGGFALSVPQSAEAQSTRDLVNRLNRIENEMETMSRAVYRGEQPTQGQSMFGQSSDLSGADRAEIEVRLSQLENELRSLRGQMEEYDFRIRQLESGGGTSVMQQQQSSYQNNSSRNASNTRDSANRPLPDFVRQPAFGTRPDDSDQAREEDKNQGGILGTIRRSFGQNNQDQQEMELAENEPSMSQRQQYTPPPVVKDLPPNTNPTEAYQQAFAMLRDKDFDRAEQAFQAFIKAFPDHSLTPNAKYWLGETYYVRNDYERAARIFAEAYQQDADGPKAADNLLKLGMSLGGMGNKEDACLTLKQLKRQFSRGSNSALSRADQEMSNLGCAG